MMTRFAWVPWGHFLAACCLLAMAFTIPNLARAADRDRLDAFLEVTGFDVALESIKLASGSAPEMLGIDPGAFGSEWTRLSDEVFDTDLMQGLALDILEKTLSDDLLIHAADFYASDLGQRLVVAENASHMYEDDATKQAEGEALVAGMVETDDPRLELIKRMNAAIDSAGHSTRAVMEIQIRFYLAASAAGVINLRMDADELRAFMEAQEDDFRLALQQSALKGATYTYQSFSEQDLEAYAEALEHPDMQQVYALMNAVQFEIMANRFEELASRMADLRPGQDI